MVILGLSQSLTFWRPRIAGQIATTPSAPVSADWSVVDATTGGTVTVSVLSLPANGGSAITGLEYDLDLSGTWLSAGISGPGNFVISGLADGTSVSVRLRAVNGMGPGAASDVKAVVPTLDTVAPSVAGVAINQATNEIDVTGVSEPGTFFALVDSLATPMSGAAIEAAVQAQTPAAFVTFPVTAGANAAVMDKTGVAGGTVYLHATVRDAAGNYSADAPLAFTQPADVVPPVLSAPAAAANGSSGATASVSTDEAGGTLYAVLTRSAVAPTPAQLRAGLDDAGAAADWAGSQAVGAIGVQTVSPPPAGLAAGTAYYAHFLQDDAAGNASAVVSAPGFSTAAAGAGPAVVASTTASAVNAPDVSVSVPANLAGDHIYYFVVGPQTLPVTVPAGFNLVTTVAGYGTTGTSCQVLQRISAGAEPAVQLFSGGWSDRVVHAASVRNSSGFAAPGASNTGWGTALNALSRSVAGGSLVFDLFLAAAAITRAGTLQNGVSGATAAALGARENLPAGASGDQLASLATANAWAALQIEILA